MRASAASASGVDLSEAGGVRVCVRACMRVYVYVRMRLCTRYEGYYLLLL